MARSKRANTTTKKHRVTCRMQVLELTKAGSAMSLNIYSDGQKLGKITIGQGSLTWQGARRQYHYTFSWTDFARLMDEYYDR